MRDSSYKVKALKQKVVSLTSIHEIGIATGFIVTAIVFSLLSNKFLTFPTFASIMTLAAELGVMSIGEAFLMISGEIDLSVGSIYALSAILFAKLIASGVPSPISLLLTLATCGVIGALNGIITIKTRIPSFITTLGSMMSVRGLVLVLTGGFTVSFMGESLLLDALAGDVGGGFRASGIWLIVLTVVFTILLNFTQYGNWVFASGGKADAARAMGVNVAKVKMINFITSSLMAGLSGTLAFSRLRFAVAAQGVGLELEAIASAVMGGCLLTGGYGSIIGTVMGAILLSMIRNGLVLAGAHPYWYTFFVGIVIILNSIINNIILRKGGIIT